MINEHGVYVLIKINLIYKAVRLRTTTVVCPHVFRQATEKEYDILVHFIPQITISYEADIDSPPSSLALQIVVTPPRSNRSCEPLDWMAELMASTRSLQTPVETTPPRRCSEVVVKTPQSTVEADKIFDRLGVVCNSMYA